MVSHKSDEVRWQIISVVLCIRSSFFIAIEMEYTNRTIALKILTH